MKNVQIGIFDKPNEPSVRPQLIELTGMEWKLDTDGAWIAQGKHGRFVLWK